MKTTVITFDSYLKLVQVMFVSIFLIIGSRQIKTFQFSEYKNKKKHKYN